MRLHLLRRSTLPISSRWSSVCVGPPIQPALPGQRLECPLPDNLALLARLANILDRVAPLPQTSTSTDQSRTSTSTDQISTSKIDQADMNTATQKAEEDVAKPHGNATPPQRADKRKKSPAKVKGRTATRKRVPSSSDDSLYMPPLSPNIEPESYPYLLPSLPTPGTQLFGLSCDLDGVRQFCFRAFPACVSLLNHWRSSSSS